MERLAQILTEATRVYALMDGQEMTAAKTLTTASMLLALTVQRVLMVSEVLIVVALLGRRACCVISTTLVLQILAMLMPFVKRAQLMAPQLVRVLKAIKEPIVLKTLMNAIKVT